MVTACEKEGDREKIKPIGKHLLIPPWRERLMQQFISQKMLRINNGPSPCRCKDGVVCAYCVQANIVLWERKEHPEEEVQDSLLKAIKKAGLRKVGRLLGIKHTTVSHWIKKKNIPSRFMEEAQRILGGGYATINP